MCRLKGGTLFLILALNFCDADEDCIKDERGKNYDGNHSTAENGLECVRWSSIHQYRFVGDHNYCRNIFNDNKPWCFTKDKSWGYCSIPRCKNYPNAGDKECLSTPDGSFYSGQVSTTRTGKTCANWESIPGKTFRTVGNHNYCRNPDGDRQPWCFVDAKVLLYDYCDIPACDDATVNEKTTIRSDLSGVVIVEKSGSESGFICADRFRVEDAKVVCRMLGHTERYADIIKDERMDEPEKIVIRNLQCSGSESNIEQCSNYQWTPYTRCRSMRAAAVVCTERTTVTPEIIAETSVAPNLKCGTRLVNSNDISQRIVGGYVTVYGAFPWMAGVRQLETLATPDKNFHHCGATIINEFHIVSAAHCFRKDKKYYRVRTGDWDNKKQDDYEQEFEIDVIKINENYEVKTFRNDIAIIKLKPINGRGIQFNDHVQPACLPMEFSQPDDKTNCYASGWGLMESAALPNFLMAARLPLMEQSYCTNLYSGKYFEDVMLCAGYFEGKIDTCGLDSGGPLVCKVNDQYTLWGIVSWGPIQCGKQNSPGVYTRVSHFNDWLSQNL